MQVGEPGPTELVPNWPRTSKDRPIVYVISLDVASGVTGPLFFWGGGQKGGGRHSSRGGADLRLGGGPRGRHRNDFFPITFIVHNQKSNGGGGGQWGAMV